MAKRNSKDNSIAAMSIDALFKLRDEVADAIASRASELRKQLSRLTGTTEKPARKSGRASKLAGMKVAPQFRSKKDPKLTWSGRGQEPRWMKEEMKGTKLTKESFRIE